MKKLITTAIAVFALAGVVEAGCGKKQNDSGTLSSFDKGTKTLVVSVDGKEVTLTATKKTVAKDANGKKTDLDSLVGKKVKVTSEHKKVDSVEAS
jgi:hypothetical protein